jgi:cell division transport system ATP-binding protein
MILLDGVSLVKHGTTIIEDISLKVDKGEFVYLVGESGAGKSSILNLIHGDVLPTTGTVLVRDLDTRRLTRSQIPYLRRTIGYIFQDYKLLRDKTAYENVAFALEVTGARRKTVRQKALQALHTVGMSHRLHHYPENLSGGECQRVAIARAVVLEPFILLADEPTGDLDERNAHTIIEQLESINHAGTAVLMATHRREFAGRAGSRVVTVSGGRIA